MDCGDRSGGRGVRVSAADQLIACTLKLASQLRCANDQIKMPDLAFHNLRHTHATS